MKTKIITRDLPSATRKTIGVLFSLCREWKAKALAYENGRSYCNGLVNSYNNASLSDQIAMKSGVEVVKRTLQEKEKAFLKTNSELNALLIYG